MGIRLFNCKAGVMEDVDPAVLARRGREFVPQDEVSQALYGLYAEHPPKKYRQLSLNPSVPPALIAITATLERVQRHPTHPRETSKRRRP